MNDQTQQRRAFVAEFNQSEIFLVKVTKRLFNNQLRQRPRSEAPNSPAHIQRHKSPSFSGEFCAYRTIVFSLPLE